MAASNHLLNKCDQKNKNVKNQIIASYSGGKLQATRHVKLLSCFFKWL